jgi:hypothetical protein
VSRGGTSSQAGFYGLPPYDEPECAQWSNSAARTHWLPSRIFGRARTGLPPDRGIDSTRNSRRFWRREASPRRCTGSAARTIVRIAGRVDDNLQIQLSPCARLSWDPCVRIQQTTSSDENP